jgi:hypothetical protein
VKGAIMEAASDFAQLELRFVDQIPWRDDAVSANLLHGCDQFNLQKGVRKGFPLTCQ